MKKIFFESLGCAKNLVDSEYMLGLIKEEGHELTDDPSHADIAVVNTCAFIRPAVEESIDAILELVTMKEKGRLKYILVAGCLVQRYGYKLLREIPEVDCWLGTGQIFRIGEILRNKKGALPLIFIDRPQFLADHNAPRVQTTPFYSSYLKIAEGCSHHCSFCIIPSLRGPYRSRTLDSLHAEAKKMVEKGVKEINLISQDTTWYGHDLNPPCGLEDLLEKLLTIHGLKWLRILYAYPYLLNERVIELINSEEVICPYIDVPLQHIDQDILRAMGRPLGSESMPQLIEKIRSKPRNIALRTTIMVGFPGETEKKFQDLCNFIREAQFDRLGVFTFNPEKGSRACRLKNRVPLEVAEKRAKEIMEIQADISRARNKKLIGETLKVLVEGLHPETDLLLAGRTNTMAPEVDGQVIINEGVAEVGQIVPVKIHKAHTYDLVGSINSDKI
ncbi:MAG: 30S ribosomal protein S12 methylthiotransferase RimO [Thermodesulfobacteriota bacterium]|nr:30S ribosomal protein S12 methylthiotransferase RimO [Thermodesulfobacteriota bacterium]